MTRRRTKVVRCPRAYAAAVGVVLWAAAHASPAPAQSSMLPECAEGEVSEILISNQSVFDLSDPGIAGGRFSWAYRLANALHFRTNPGVIERELLFDVGDCYDVESLRDSERLLRRFAFLADAEVFGIRQEDGTVQVVVDTQDEWSTRIEPDLESNGKIGFAGIRLVEDNLFGSGQALSLFYENEDGEEIYGAGYAAPQFFGTRTDFAARIAQTDVGESYRVGLAYPFVGETGRFGFRQTASRDDRYFELFRPTDGDRLTRLWQPIRREEAEIGVAVRRGGERYNQTILGVALAAERLGFPAMPVFADSAGNPEVPSSIFDPGYVPLSTTRIVGLVGKRDVQFVRRQGFDTVHGTEDIRLGYESELSFGPTIPFVQEDQSIALSAGISWATEALPGLIVGLQSAVEGQRRFTDREDVPEWSDLLGEFDGWAYLRPSIDSRHTIAASFTMAGGWNTTTPFQLTLGSDTGLRGYPRHLDPGGRRIVGSVEHRTFLGGPFGDLLDLGTVLFADAGKIWPGEAPFGVESPVRATVGAGLRAAFPPGSRQTFRADIGFPLNRSGDVGGVVISVGVGQLIGRGVDGRDGQLVRSGRYSLSTSDFSPY